MNRFRVRTMSQDESVFRSTFDIPVFVNCLSRVPTYKEVIAPYFKRTKIFNTKVKKQKSHPTNDSIEREKVKKFLIEKKVEQKPQIAFTNRDISHLKDKKKKIPTNVNIEKNLTNLDSENRAFPGLKDLRDLGRNQCVLFPKFFSNKKEPGSQVYEKDWISCREGKSVYGRQDIENFKTWFEETKKKLDKFSTSLDEVKGFMLASIKELYLEISYQSTEHGNILLELFEMFSSVVDKYACVWRDSEKAVHLKNQESIRETLQEKIRQLKEKIDNFEIEKKEWVLKESSFNARIKSLQESLDLQTKIIKNPILRKASFSMYNAEFSLEKFANNLKKKFGEIGEVYDSFIDLPKGALLTPLSADFKVNPGQEPVKEGSFENA